MLYGGLQLRDTDSIQVNTNSQVFLGTTRMRQQWFPGPFSSTGNGLDMRLVLLLILAKETGFPYCEWSLGKRL